MDSGTLQASKETDRVLNLLFWSPNTGICYSVLSFSDACGVDEMMLFSSVGFPGRKALDREYHSHNFC